MSFANEARNTRDAYLDNSRTTKALAVEAAQKFITDRIGRLTFEDNLYEILRKDALDEISRNGQIETVYHYQEWGC